MDFTAIVKKAIAFTFFALILSACDGGGGIAPPVADTTAPNPPQVSLARNSDGTVTVSGSAEKNSTIIINFPDGTTLSFKVPESGQFSETSTTPISNNLASQVLITATDSSGNESDTTNVQLDATPLLTSALTSSNKPIVGIEYSTGSNTSGETSPAGLFSYQAGNTISFSIAGTNIGSVDASNLPITLEELVNSSTNPVIKYLPLLLSDLNTNNTTTVNAKVSLLQLEQALFKPDTLPFNRSLGINLETPQAEADAIYQPLPFADIFRVSRPFKENSCSDISYDSKGWPQNLPVSCAGEKAITRILQFMPAGAAPAGRYNVLYDGKGNINFSGMASNKIQFEEGHLTIDVSPLPADTNARGIEVSISSIDESDPIRNIRITLPGGICKGNPFLRVDYENQCTANSPFISFYEVLKNNRDAIVFNPDFLNFHKDFRVLRMMNFMEATPRRPESNYLYPCPASTEAGYVPCLTRPREWTEIAKMSDANWGGSFKTIVTKRFGVPLEVSVALANLLQAHPWFTIPFNANDTYVNNYAEYINTHLNKSLKAHIEYTNEFWNGGFWGSQYTLEMGKKLGLNLPVLPFRDEDHSARVRFYSKRAVEIFDIFKQKFGGTDKLVRIIGSYHKSHALSREILSYNDTANSTDVLAVAPYFHGCWARTRNGKPIKQCSDTNVVTKVLTQATSVNDVFAVIGSTYDPTKPTTEEQGDTDSISAITQLISNQVTVANEYGVDLYAYEGGQHLKVNFGDESISLAKRDSLQDFFIAANKDSRMGALYATLLTEWKNKGGKQFVLFTSPQTYNRHGLFGIKEYINQSRSDAPKYDAAMTFQENQAGCWWDACTP